VLEGYEKVFGAVYPSTLTGIANLALTCRDQRRWKEAGELEVQVIETRKRVLREEYLDTLTSMANPQGSGAVEGGQNARSVSNRDEKEGA